MYVMLMRKVFRRETNILTNSRAFMGEDNTVIISAEIENQLIN